MSSYSWFQFCNRCIFLSTSIIPLYIIVVLEKCHIIYFSMIFIFGTYLKLRNICILFLFNRGNLISNWVKNISSQLQHTPHIINIYYITSRATCSLQQNTFGQSIMTNWSLNFIIRHINTEYLFVTISIIKKRPITMLYQLVV